MIDEKKIEEAARKNAEESCSPTFQESMEVGFKDGIDWFLGKLWHNVSEEPKEGLLLVEYNGGMMHLFSLVHTKEFKYPSSGVKRWLYIDDLLKGANNG